MLHLLVPTTDLTNEYGPALTCSFGGLITIAHGPPLSEPSINISASLTWGGERYRYPTNLPKVAATGGPKCMGLPTLPFNTNPPQFITDIGANPVGYGNPQLLINSDLLKQLLYGPIAGPPATPHRWGCPDENTRHTDQVRHLRGCDGDADRLPVLHLRPVPHGCDERLFGGVHRRVAAQAGAVGAGRRDPGGHGQQRFVAAGQKVVVKFDADRNIVLTEGTRAAVRYLNLVGDRYLELVDGPGSPKRLPAGGQIPVSRTAPALDLDLLLGGLKPVTQGLNARDVNALTSGLLQVFQGQGGTLDSLFTKATSFSNALADNDQTVQQLIDNLNIVIGTISKDGKQFSGAVDRLERLVSGLSDDRNTIGSAIDALDREPPHWRICLPRRGRR